MIAQNQTSVCGSAPIPCANVLPTPVEMQDGKVVEKLNRVNLKGFIESQDGLFVSVDFVKLDGQPRTLTGRLGVTAPLKGGANTVEAYERPYLTVFDVEARGYRTVNLGNVSQIRARNKVYRVVD